MHNWPPIWIEKYGDNKILSGEIGVLKHIGTNPALGNRYYLHITYNQRPYVGSVMFDDADFCAFIGDLLKVNIDRSIEAIGDLDLSGPL